jgi:hypothetical protein
MIGAKAPRIRFILLGPFSSFFPLIRRASYDIRLSLLSLLPPLLPLSIIFISPRQTSLFHSLSLSLSLSLPIYTSLFLYSLFDLPRSSRPFIFSHSFNLLSLYCIGYIFFYIPDICLFRFTQISSQLGILIIQVDYFRQSSVNES